MRKIVVTGSSGRIGKAIHDALSRTHEAVGIDRLPAASTAIVATINDYDRLCRAFEGADAVVHAAALHAPHLGSATWRDFVLVNVKGTETVLKAAKSTAVRRLVFTSTTALYGVASTDVSDAVWVDEATTPQPRTIHHSTKLEAEEVLEASADKGLAMRVLRVSRCFPEPVPRMAVYRLHRGVDERDAAAAHLLALQNEGRPYERYVVSARTPSDRGDCGPLKRDAGQVIRRKCPGLADAFDGLGWVLPKSIDRVYDSRLAQRALGWHPRFGYEAVIPMERDRDFDLAGAEGSKPGHASV